MKHRYLGILPLMALISAGWAAPEPAVLQNSAVRMQVLPEHGTISQIDDIAGRTSLKCPPEQADNFVITLQNPDKSFTPILGKNQKVTELTNSGGTMQITWKAPLTDVKGGKHDIDVKMSIEAQQNGLAFALTVSNREAAKVQEARYPVIGGWNGYCKPGTADGVLWVPTSNPTVMPLGAAFNTATFGYPGHSVMSFCAVSSPSAKRVAYFAPEDTVARHKNFRFETVGAGAAKDVQFSVDFHPFVPQGQSWAGPPVALRYAEGDQKQAGQIYRNWFSKTFGISQPEDNWIRRESFFVMTMFMLPEGTISMKFKDIPKWAKAAKEHGINALQVSGWQIGGHDNGYPYYTIDPRLGTWDELKAGIDYAHKLGQKVYFFVNYQAAMLESDWYKNELEPMREMGPNGELTWNAGWGMGTLWARMGNSKKMTWIDLSFPKYRKIIVDYFSKLAQIGGDGVHVDKMFPSAIEYNPNAPMSPDTATWEGAIVLTKEIMTECRKHNPNWSMSFECNWDRMIQFGGATWWVGNQLATRTVFPENVETMGHYQPYDYLGLNNGIRGGHAIMVAPLNFSRGVDWKPFEGMADYYRDVKKIRDELQEAVFWGEVMGQTGIEFPDSLPGGIEYNTFRNQKTNRRVVVITNSVMSLVDLSLGSFTGGGKSARYHVPGKKARTVTLPVKVSVPAERVVFLEEMEAAK